MKATIVKKDTIKATGAYTGAIALCLLILTWVMKLWSADLKIPFGYGGDALLSGMVIKGIIDNGWYLHNNFIGMPMGLDMYDFPMADNFHFLLLKLISLIVSDYAMTLNLYFLLTFPLTTLSALYVFRQFKLGFASSIVGSLLFTFLPYHFLRGQGHLFLAAYYSIPLIVMVILWVYSGETLFFKSDKNSKKPIINVLNFNSVISIVICLLIASTGAYYAFFACFFLLVAGISASYHRKKMYCLLTSIILTAAIFVGVLVNISPSIVYKHYYGENTEVANRSKVEAEMYGMKITQLLLPVSGHRVSYLDNGKTKYNNSAPLVNENDSSTLGAIGSFGFLILIGWIFYRKPAVINMNLYTNLSELNASALLLATTGGFGSLFAILISPQIRAYNRVSVYIAFFCLFAVVLLLEKIHCEYAKSKIARFFYYSVLGLILLIGIMDQTTEYFVPPYASLKAEYSNDADFVKKIEASIPKNAMIFQLPYVSFPENPPVHKMGDYELFRGYLNSQTLRWSYGAMKGREGDIWQRNVAEKPVEELVETLSLAGFSGIYLDRNGYSDMGANLEARLSTLIGTKPLVSANNRLVFFNMAEYNQRFKNKFTAKEWELKQDIALQPLLVTWRSGFSHLEGTPENNWRWSSSEGELHINNTSQRERKVTLEMYFGTGYEEISNLLIDSPLLSARLKINAKNNFFSKTITIPPGRYTIKFVSDAKRINAPGDPRFLVFRVVNFRIKDVQ